MKIVNVIKSLATPSASEQLAKLDPRLLADIGISAAYSDADVGRVPADLGVRLV